MTSPTLHDSEKVLLGSVGSSDREVTNEVGDPSTFLAGLAVRRTTTGALSLSSGSLIGVSLGKSLSDDAKTSVLRVGNKVPMRLSDQGEFASLEEGDLTFIAKSKGVAGNEITIALLDEKTDASAEVVSEDGLDIVVHIEDGETTALAIKNAIDASPHASSLITVEIADGESATKQDAFVETALDNGIDSFGYITIGDYVKVNATTGLVDPSGSATGACFVSGPLKGIDPFTGAEIDVCLVDMGGGL